MECSDQNCPVHGNVRVRGKSFEGEVVRFKTDDTAVVRWDRIVNVPKFERAYKTGTRMLAHVPGCMKVREGDRVRVGETRKLSRAMSFVILEVLADGKKD